MGDLERGRKVPLSENVRLSGAIEGMARRKGGRVSCVGMFV